MSIVTASDFNNSHSERYAFARLPQRTVRCAECGAIGYSEDNYCACCGRAIPKHCRTCGSSVAHAVANYCTNCGAPMHAAQEGSIERHAWGERLMAGNASEPEEWSLELQEFPESAPRLARRQRSRIGKMPNDIENGDLRPDAD
jgi:hypothetical protein